jgi:hypothetical protein
MNFGRDLMDKHVDQMPQCLQKRDRGGHVTNQLNCTTSTLGMHIVRLAASF